MATDQEKPTLRCDTVLLSSRGIAETHGKKAVIFVPASDIQRITLKYGRPEHNPVAALTIGTLFALVGVFGLIEFIRAPRGYRYEIGMLVFGAIGGTIIFEALRERHFLEVETKNGVRRLVFSKNAQKSEIDTFCQQARNSYNHSITEAGPAS